MVNQRVDLNNDRWNCGQMLQKEIISAWSFHARQEPNLNEGLPESVKTRELHHVPV